MTEYEWLLFLHVTGAFLLGGGSVAAAALNVAAQVRERPSEIALSLTRVAVVSIIVGALATIGFGLWLVSEAPFGYGY
jgi:hypothetical protein